MVQYFHISSIFCSPSSRLYLIQSSPNRCRILCLNQSSASYNLISLTPMVASSNWSSLTSIDDGYSCYVWIYRTSFLMVKALIILVWSLSIRCFCIWIRISCFLIYTLSWTLLQDFNTLVMLETNQIINILPKKLLWILGLNLGLSSSCALLALLYSPSSSTNFQGIFSLRSIRGHSRVTSRLKHCFRFILFLKLILLTKFASFNIVFLLNINQIIASDGVIVKINITIFSLWNWLRLFKRVNVRTYRNICSPWFNLLFFVFLILVIRILSKLCLWVNLFLSLRQAFILIFFDSW